MIKIEWIGPSGYTPGIGRTYEGSQHLIEDDLAKRVISEGIARRMPEKSHKPEKDKGDNK